MARKNKMQTFTAKKKVTTTTRVFFFFDLFFLSALVLNVAVSHNELNQKLKMVSHNDNKRALQRWTDVYHEGDRDDKGYEGKGTKRKQETTMRQE